MKVKIRFAAMAALLLAVAGCATSQMKSTPFYSGSETVYTGKVEDRVNLWPIGYYREPMFSLVWPLFSVTDDHLALRPVYSQFRQRGKGSPYDEFNFLWPICQFDTRHHDHRFFPVFWGEDYFHVFPLLWNKDDTHCLFPIVWWRENEYFNIFPVFWNTSSDLGVLPLFWKSRRSLWIAPSFYCDENLVTFFPFYGRDTSGGELTHWFGPAGYHRGKENADWCFPLYYRDDDSFLTPLYGRDRKERSEWAFPLYYRSADRFVSLPYASGEKDGTSTWVVPPLLSWGEKSEKESFNAYLLGLGGYSRGPDGQNSQWMLPFFWRDQSMLFTPLAGYDRSVDGSWVFPFYYNDRDEFLSFFYWRKLREQDGRRALAAHGTFPFWYSDDTSFVSPFYISSDEGKERSWFVPPLLSFGFSDDKGWTRCALLGLGGAHRGTDGAFADWSFPLYYRDNTRFVTPLFGKTASAQWCFPLWYRGRSGSTDDFLSLLWCASHMGKESFYFIPPLLTGFDGEGNFFTPLGGALGKESWLLPLWWKDEQKFVSPLFCKRFSSGTVTIPPLLSWFKQRSERYEGKFLLGLGGWSRYYDGDLRSHWAFPLYHHDARDGEFHSILFSHARKYTCLTPFFGAIHSPLHRGAWFWPLCGATFDRRMDEAEQQIDADRLPEAAKVMRKENVVKRNKGGDLTNVWHKVSGMTSAHDGGWHLSGLGTSDRRIDWHHAGEKAIVGEAHGERGNVLAYKSRYDRTVRFDTTTRKKTSDCERGEKSVLGTLLWHSEYEKKDGEVTYAKKSILWRFWHYEKLDGDVSVDSFPFFTYDAKKNGYSKVSLLWRLFRSERDEKGGRKVDLLFLPVWR